MSVILLRTVAACSAAPESEGAQAEKARVSGGAHAEMIARMIDRLQHGDSEPCSKLVGNLGMASSDVIGPASQICNRPFAHVIDIVQTGSSVVSTVTVREQHGQIIHSVMFAFRDGRLITVTSGWPFPKPPAAGARDPDD